MQVLYIVTRGAQDATGASIPLHLAANGSLEVGQDVSVILAGDGTEILRLRQGIGAGRDTDYSSFCQGNE